MEISELLHDNWFNLVIIFTLSCVAFIYKRPRSNKYFDNLIKYADILEKTSQPKYQRDYLSNIKKKLLWDKICFYKSGDIEKENIAMSLVNADINNIIDLTQLNLFTQYFTIQKNRLIPLAFYSIKEVVLSGIILIFVLFLLLFNIYRIFSSPWIVNAIISILTIFIILFITCRFALDPIKRLKTYLVILKNQTFLQRANNELTKIIEERQANSSTLE
ncbi:hypothetical protein [Gilliamella apicola]|uniref:Uncharacterized protein n=1 Tax=Gilliamella apicola TaxID=1196095 RepID=A0A242NEL4_9GAMM|nr:hypothetical protein [Gilliamella apicola]OTP81570.1 hypothetical protein B5S40_10835 [Gilliamella apicola]OTP84430.1 hypothetical protein B5S44_10420 [Gilliamella apicola]OTP98255.1 hypothetical protein B6D08_11830 [Gilliamella apicola]OTQ07944.1 hypothetical protein B6C91_13840 [Gilliamella apicola]OTQ14604.1 hypothetical protein B6D11_07455 [Gilliamella apicola]